MDGGVSDYLTAAILSRGGKRKGGNPTGDGGNSSMVSCMSLYWAQEEVKMCCSCSRYLTCFSKGLFKPAFECQKIGWHCT